MTNPVFRTVRTSRAGGRRKACSGSALARAPNGDLIPITAAAERTLAALTNYGYRRFGPAVTHCRPFPGSQARRKSTLVAESPAAWVTH